MTQDIKYADIKELRKFGYIQEINRQFLHPLGLALEISIDKDGNESLGGIWDYRDYPEGMEFEHINQSKLRRVRKEQRRRARVRKEMLGYVIQKKDYPHDVKNVPEEL